MKNLTTMTLVLATATIACADINDGLLAHWRLDGNAQDASGNGHHGSVATGSPTAGSASASAHRVAAPPTSASRQKPLVSRTAWLRRRAR